MSSALLGDYFSSVLIRNVAVVAAAVDFAAASAAVVVVDDDDVDVVAAAAAAAVVVVWDLYLREIARVAGVPILLQAGPIHAA